MGQHKLCSGISKVTLKNNTVQYIELVKDATHLCLKCGRVANKKKTLCSPRKLKLKPADTKNTAIKKHK